MAGESLDKAYEQALRVDAPVLEWLRSAMAKYGAAL